MKKLAIVFLVVVMLFSCMAVTASADDVKTLKLATDAALEYPTTKALTKFADTVAEKSEGKIQIEIYPSSILGDEVSYLEQLQLGTVDLAKLSVGTLNGLYTDLQAFNLPFMFKNNTELWKVLESEVGENIKTGLNQFGIQGLGFTDNGSRNFYTNKPIESIDDFKGMTIRVQQNNIMIKMVENLGANAVNVAANEVYSALQTGVCDGGENNPNTILADSVYEVANYVTLDSHTTGMDVICINLDLWNSFTEEEQQIFNEAMAEATAYDREIWDESVASALKQLEENGATVTTPSDEILTSFKEAMAPLYEEYTESLGEWIDAINAVLAE